MTPNDLYSECVPVHRKRTSTESMFFPLDLGKPDRFRAPMTEIQVRRGNRTMLRNSRAVAMLRRLGL